MRLGIKEIEAILPHRHPFLLVDYIEEAGGKSGRLQMCDIS